MSIKETLTNLAYKRAPGPLPAFNILDLIRFLRILAESECMGRGKIARKLDLGEGTTRTIIKRLTEESLITKSRSGCSLTYKGKKLWSKIREILPKIVEIEDNELTLAPYSVAVLVKGCAKKVKSGLEQRDAAIISGARSAVTMVFKDNRLIIPGVSFDLRRDYPLAFREIMRLMKPEEGDVIIISSADTLKCAEYGALAAALSII